MKNLMLLVLVASMFSACETTTTPTTSTSNPVFNEFNQPIDFASITAQNVIDATEESKLEADALVAEIVAIPDNERTFKNTMIALDEVYDVVNSVSCIVGLLANASTDSLIRTTAQEKDTEISQYDNQLGLNEDLYNAVKAYSKTEEANNLTGWQEKFTVETVDGFERSGFALPKEQRDQLQVIMDELTVIQQEFGTNINDYEDWMYITEEQTAGLPDDYKNARLQEDGTYKIGVSYPDIRPMFRNCEDEKTRKKLLFMYQNRAADKNMEVLNRMIKKRNEYANLLGYDNYADYNLGDKMAEKADVVWDFNKELLEKAKVKGYADLEEMTTFQREDMNIDKDHVEPWSRSFVTDKLLKKNYGVDAEEVRQYFPLESVIDGLFSITQNLFDLEYKEMKNASVWHEDVLAYEVFDDGNLIGRFYLDLHPRANKYSHAACFPVIIARNTDNGFQIPTSSLECNFSAPAEGKPALMTHAEVTTFFHEFGHVLHSLLSKSELSVQSGFFVARDFIEAPSQIFENWVWNYESLSLFAKHWETGEVLPEELFNKMYSAKTVMSGRNTLYQLFLGALDMTLYSSYDPDGAESITSIREKLDEEINLVAPVPGTHMAAAFGHLNGYGASYYGYLWSKVFAQDMFSRFEDEGIFSKDAGLDYKNIILAQGATKDEMDMLREFLGRDPEKDAFVRSLGLK